MLKRIVIGFISIIISLYLAIWLLSAPIAHYFLSQQLTTQNIKISTDTVIRYNPFISQLTISKLTLTKEDSTVLSLQNLTLQLALHQLIFKKLVIQQFTLNDLFLQIIQNDKQLIIAGFDLSIDSSNSTPNNKATKQDESFIKTILLPQLTIEQAQIGLQLNKQNHQLTVNKLQINDLIANSKEIITTISFDGAIDKAASQLEVKLHYKDQQTNIDSQINIQQYSLVKIKPYVPQLSELNGFISVKLNPVVQLSEQHLKVKVSDTRIKPEKVKLTLNNFIIKIPMLDTTIDHLKFNIAMQQAEQLDFSLTQIKLQTKQPIIFIDNNFSPSVNRTLLVNEFKLGALNTLKSDTKTPFSLLAHSNKYSKLQFEGDLKPFAKIPEYHLKGQIKEFSLPSISPYLKQAMNLELQSGQLNSNIALSLLADKIEGNIDLLIKGLETTSTDSNEVNLLKDNSMLPLNAALDMLKDNNGDLELSIPLSGSTNDPQFGMQSFIALVAKKAIASATQTYLIKTFVPYANIVTVALSVSDSLLKVRFEPLYYQAKQIAPTKEQQTYLKQLIQLLNDKKEANVKLCAISVPADIEVKNNVTLSKEQQQKLLNLGQQREHTLKDYLLKNSNINSERLLFCMPKIDKAAMAQPRIELSS